MGFKQAVIKVEKGKTIKAFFNPAEYNLSDSANYTDKSVPGYDGPIVQYISGAASVLTMTLIFDTYVPPSLDDEVEKGTDVSILTRDVMELTKITGQLHRPPIVTFCWGPIKFEGIVTDVKQNFTMFLSDGMPVRAKVEVTFKSILDLKTSKRKSPFESPDRTKFCTVHEKEQLWNYAIEEYQDASQWRTIAKANDISNPLDIEPGQLIKLPAL